MSTETKSTTRCDGPNCEHTNPKHEMYIAKGWARLNRSDWFGISLGRKIPPNQDSLDFCSPQCLADWAAEAARKADAPGASTQPRTCDHCGQPEVFDEVANTSVLRHADDCPKRERRPPVTYSGNHG